MRGYHCCANFHTDVTNWVCCLLSLTGATVVIVNCQGTGGSVPVYSVLKSDWDGHRQSWAQCEFVVVLLIAFRSFGKSTLCGLSQTCKY
jgi:hypothetical protein